MSNGALVTTTAISRRPAPKWSESRNVSKPLPTEPISKNRWEGKLLRPVSDAIESIGRASQVIRCWLPSNGVSFVLAERGSGKTLMLLDQALALATDRPWMGFPTEKGRFVVYLIGEDEQGTIAHVEAWYKKHGVPLSDCAPRIYFVPMVPDLLSENDCRSLVRYVRGRLPPNAKPVIFIDTWQRATAGGGQSDDKCMQIAINNAESIGRELGGPVVAASHPPKGRKNTISGSSVIENSSVAIWQLEKVSNGVSVKVIRIKGVGQGTDLGFRIQQVEVDGEDNFHEPRTGAVLCRGISTNSSISTSARSRAVGEREIGLLRAMKTTPGASLEKLASAVVWNDASKPTASMVKNVMNKLLARNFVRLDPGGHYAVAFEGDAFLDSKPV